jgi:predicted nucleic acid-binding protein
LRYWDSSALVALFVQQTATSDMQGLYSQDPGVVTWTLSEIEILSALCRLEREGDLDPDGFQRAVERLDELLQTVDTVNAFDAVKVRARRLLRTHVLRAADALQLGAALVCVSDDPSRWPFVCLDDRLAAAARREGFAVLP